MENEIHDQATTLVTALERGDAAAAGVVYADGARLLASTAEPIDGRAEIEAYWRAGIELGLGGVTFESRVLEWIGGGALESGGMPSRCRAGLRRRPSSTARISSFIPRPPTARGNGRSRSSTPTSRSPARRTRRRSNEAQLRSRKKSGDLTGFSSESSFPRYRWRASRPARSRLRLHSEAPSTLLRRPRSFSRSPRSLGTRRAPPRISASTHRTRRCRSTF